MPIPSRKPRSRVVPLLALTLLLGISLLMLSCDGEPPAVAEARAATNAAEAELLEQGRRLAHGGEWEAAAEAFNAASADPGDTGLTARYELALIHDQLDRPREAIATLAGLLERTPATEPVVRGWFLQGSVQLELGDSGAAAAAFGRYVELGGVAAAFARLEQGRALSATDREAALAALQPLLGGASPGYVRRQALRLAGNLEEAAERDSVALAHYQELLTTAAFSAERVAALARIGALQRRAGNTDAAAEAYVTLAARYPFNGEAEEALRLLVEIGRPADPLTAGLVHYRRRNNQPARDQFNLYLRTAGGSGPGAATALFYLGALAERRDDINLALENYAESFQADPAGPLAVEALWERAAVLDYSERGDEAITAYNLVAQRFPASSRAGDALFRAGYLAYRAGRTAQARQIWSGAISATANAAAARAALWSGRAAADLGDVTAARQFYSEAVRRDPAGYHGLRAAAILAGEPRAPEARRGSLTAVAPDWAATEAWLGSWAGAEDVAGWQNLSGSEEWRLAVELPRLVRQRAGSDMSELVINAVAREPWLLYRIARAMDEAGQANLAYKAAAYLFERLPAAATPVDPSLARLAYPAPWPEAGGYYAAQYGVDPLLLYALMRQESAFDPTAGSSAGAFGLTQVIPGTAQEIARALGKTPFAFRDLARPAIAIQFGAYYIGAQLRAFGGNTYQALAAYNGGGGNATRWARPAGAADIDRFYEEIDYAETKLYLRIVIQNYAWYRHLYGGAPQPSLTGQR